MAAYGIGYLLSKTTVLLKEAKIALPILPAYG
jgi:hypothetical protein